MKRCGADQSGTGPCESSPSRGPSRPPFFPYFPVAPGGQGAPPPSTPVPTAHHEYGHVAQVLAVQGADIGLAGAKLAAFRAPAPGPWPLLAPPGCHGLVPSAQCRSETATGPARFPRRSHLGWEGKGSTRPGWVCGGLGGPGDRLQMPHAGSAPTPEPQPNWGAAKMNQNKATAQLVALFSAKGAAVTWLGREGDLARKGGLRGRGQEGGR